MRCGSGSCGELANTQRCAPVLLRCCFAAARRRCCGSKAKPGERSPPLHAGKPGRPCTGRTGATGPRGFSWMGLRPGLEASGLRLFPGQATTSPYSGDRDDRTGRRSGIASLPGSCSAASSVTHRRRSLNLGRLFLMTWTIRESPRHCGCQPAGRCRRRESPSPLLMPLAPFHTTLKRSGAVHEARPRQPRGVQNRTQTYHSAALEKPGVSFTTPVPGHIEPTTRHCQTKQQQAEEGQEPRMRSTPPVWKG